MAEPPREPPIAVVASQDADPRVNARDVALVLTVALLITAALVAISRDFAITRDERARHTYGVRVLQFWRGRLTTDSFVATQNGAHLYAALFDSTAALLHEQLGGDVWNVRHACNAVAGGLGVLGIGLTALRLFGTPSALIAMALLVCSPRYVGDAMNNPKDIPFAAACSLTLAALTLVRGSFPFLTWVRALVIGMALAAALNVRPGALIYLAFTWTLLAALTWRARAWAPRQLLVTTGHAALISMVMLVAGTAFWPWAQRNPLVRPFDALLQVSDFQWHGTLLFFGREISAHHPPATYVPVWIAITTPPVVLAGLLLAGWTTMAMARQRLRCLALWSAAIVPVALVIARSSTLYDGWRHLLFTYPPLVVLAAWGWAITTRVAASRHRTLAVPVVAVLAAGCIEPVLFMARNHPHEVVYFSPLVGGPRGAFGRFDMDYWGCSLVTAMRWCASVAERSGVPLTVAGRPPGTVAINASRESALAGARPQAKQHHLEVELLRAPSRRLVDALSSGRVLHVVRTADGTPLAAIYEGPRFREVAARVQRHLAEP